MAVFGVFELPALLVLCFGAIRVTYGQVKSGWPEDKHCDAVTVHLIAETITKWLTDEYTGQGNDSGHGWERAGGQEILPRYCEVKYFLPYWWARNVTAISNCSPPNVNESSQKGTQCLWSCRCCHPPMVIDEKLEGGDARSCHPSYLPPLKVNKESRT